MQTKHARTLLSLAIGFAFASPAFSAVVPAGTVLADKQEIALNNGDEPASLDPNKVEGVPEAQVIRQLFEGLVTVDADGNDVPGVAESWQSPPDYKTWTFKLRPDAKWSNGDPVTAQDFVYSWQRLADPKTASPYSSFLTYLQLENAQDIIDGKKAPSGLGVKATDDHTLVLTLSNPVPYAADLTSHTSLSPVNKKAIEKYSDAWVKKGNLVSNGAYTLADHVINEKVVFERNKNYWNDKDTVINKATFLAIPNPTTDISRYRAGDVNLTNNAIPSEQFAKLKKEIPNELSVGRMLSTYFYEINNAKKPFNDIRVRKALNLALERELITDKVLGQGQTPTYVFTPPYILEGEQIKQPAYSTLPMTWLR